MLARKIQASDSNRSGCAHADHCSVGDQPIDAGIRPRRRRTFDCSFDEPCGPALWQFAAVESWIFARDSRCCEALPTGEWGGFGHSRRVGIADYGGSVADLGQAAVGGYATVVARLHAREGPGVDQEHGAYGRGSGTEGPARHVCVQHFSELLSLASLLQGGEEAFRRDRYLLCGRPFLRCIDPEWADAV